MKKIVSILTTGLLLLTAFSCTEVEMTQVNSEDSVAPVLLSATTDGKIVVTYTPATFYMGDSSTPVAQSLVKHSLVLVKLDGSICNVSLTTKDENNTLTVEKKALNNALRTLHCAEETTHDIELVVRAALSSTANTGYLDSEGRVSTSFTVYVEKGSPYSDYSEKSDWSLIGSMAAYGISWDKDLCMWTDGNGNHVAAHVTLKAGDEVKFRKDQDWVTNFGGDMGSLDSEFEVTQGGPNIKIAADGVYDLYLYAEAGKAMISEAYDPIPSFTQESAWGVTGALPAYEISWDKDIAMISDGTSHVALSVQLGAEDEFKFRKDGAWTVNLGGDFGSLDNEFSVTQGGPNIKVGAAGVYDLYVNPDAGTAKVTEAAGLKVSTIIGDEPGPEDPPQPEPVTGWNIIGLNGDWDNDVRATEKEGVWTAYITATDETTFKWRKDGDWAEDYGLPGGASYTMNTPFQAVQGGENIPVAAGFYKVVLDLTNESNPLITVFDDFEIYSLIGDFNGWGADVDLEEVGSGIWVSPATALTTGGFKIRSGHDWSLSWGGTLVDLGVAFDAISDNGPNIVVPSDGEYIVTFDKPNLKITVEPALPSNTWSLIGVNGDWNNDIFMSELMPGVWVSPEVEITSEGWKIRFNHDWAVNRGCADIHLAGEFGKAVQDGGNLPITGKFKVIYNANNETIGTLVWGVVGSIASIPGFSWNADVPMNLASDGKWYSIPVTLAEGDEIKIRRGAAWDENYGGTFGEANAPFSAVSGGDNIKAAGTYMVVYDPANGTLELSNRFWGVIGDFSSWGADLYMLFDGAKWNAYGQNLAGGWKLRQGADWSVNRGGTLVEAGVPFAVENNGPNVDASVYQNYDIVYDPAAETITVG